MNIDLVNLGEKLTADLHSAAKKFDPRSDDCDILEYEALAVEIRLREIDGLTEKDTDRRESSLLSDWGAHTRAKIPELTDRVREFYRLYECK